MSRRERFTFWHPKVLRHTDAQTEAIDVSSGGDDVHGTPHRLPTLRVDDQTGLSHVASAPALELRALQIHCVVWLEPDTSSFAA